MSTIPECRSAGLRVMDLTSFPQEETFYVSTMDRVVLSDALQGRDDDAISKLSSGNSEMHEVSIDPVELKGMYRVDSHANHCLKLVDDKNFAMEFYEPTMEVDLGTQLFSANMSMDGKFLGAGGADGAFHVIHVPTAQRVALQGHVGDITTIEFFPSSVVALTGSTDFRLRIWSMESFKCAAVLQRHTSAITGVGILGRGRNITSCAADGKVLLWNVGTSEQLSTWSLASSATCMAIWNNALPLIGNEVNTKHPLESETEGKVLFVGTEHHGVQGIDVRSTEPITKLNAPSSVTSCALYPAVENSILVGCENGIVSTYDLRRTAAPLTMVSRSSAAVHGFYPKSN
ncbi:hypothetical protein THRCLA_05385, partial [Thraustotheca clavata]